MNIPDYFDAWVHQSPNIRFAPKSQGGWERWAQVDFALWMESTGIVTILEDPCFKGNSKRDDLTITDKACTEFKTFNNSESISQYKKKLEDDVDKLKTNTLKDDRSKCEKYSIGIASVAAVVAALKSTYPSINDKNVFQYINDYFGGEHSPYHHESAKAHGDVEFIITFCKVG